MNYLPLTSRRSAWYLACLALLAASTHSLCAQDARMRIVLEKRVGKSVQQTSPQHVFAAGDNVRFRFRSSFDGYLYVMDQSTSGKYLVLFPASGVAETNRIVRDKDYLIPATTGSWFRVDDPPGYEKVYFVISSTKLEKEVEPQPAPLPSEPSPSNPPPELLPRCDDSVFRARGDCVDSAAGPHAIREDEKLPDRLPGSPASQSRDITVINKSTSSVVAPGDLNGAPLVYEFRLAHH